MQIITRHLPATASRVSKHSTRQNKAPSSPTASQAYTALAGFQLILPGRIALQAAASIHAAPTVNSQAHSYRILPGENRILSKRVKYCMSHAILRSVCFQFTC